MTRRAACAAALLCSAIVAAGAAPGSPSASAAHPGPNGPVAFSHVEGAIIIAQPGQNEPSQWTEVIRPPTGTTVSLTEPSISPDGRRVAYRLEGPFDAELWLYDRQSQQTTRLAGGNVGPPSWTPDGSSIVFAADDTSDLLRKIGVINVDTATSSVIAEIPTLETALSPAGDQILYWDDVNDRLGLLDVATGQQRVVFTSGTDGIIVGQTLREFRPGGGPPRREVNVVQMNWSPDSRSFVFNCGFVDTQQENNGFLCTMNSNGTGVRIITGGPFAGNSSSGSFTPQGNQIMFSAFPPPTAPRLFIMPAAGMNADASNVTQVTFQNGALAHFGPDVGVPLGTTPAPPASTPVPAGSGGGGSDGDIVSMTPARLLDTRSNGATTDDLFARQGRVGQGKTLELDVTGRGGVPASGVGAVVLNVAAVGPDGPGFMTVFPCGERPNASSLNYAQGANRATEVIAKVSAAGTVCVFTSQASNVIADVTGYSPDDAELFSLVPARVLDTRPNGATVDGEAVALGRVEGDSLVELTVADRGGVPATGASAAVLNVTAVNATGNGFVSVFPCGDLPNASSLNFRGGANVANEVIAGLTQEGTVCVYTSVDAHLLVDVTGYTSSDSGVTSIVPARVLETRSDSETIDGESAGGGAINGGDVVEVQIAGRGGVPAGVDAAVLNVTSLRGTTGGFLSVFPCGEVPNASSLNFDANTNTANEVVAKLSVSGAVCVFASTTTHMLLDVTGYVTG